VKNENGNEMNPRSRWEIILDILSVISEEEREVKSKVKKTRVMQKAYLDWRNFQRHFDFLLKQGFVGYSEEQEGDKGYYLTEKGRDLLRGLREVEDILQ